MKAAPRLIPVRVPDQPVGVVLVLHGGASREADTRVSPTQLSVLRMIPIAKRIAFRGHGRLAVFRLLNSVRGWDTHHTPVHDAKWAMQQLREQFGKVLPMSLVGHSLGGRAALLAAGEPEVHSAVALAPWMYASDGSAGLEGRQVLIVHGSDDHIANPANSAAAARTLSTTADVGYIRISGGKHAMLRHHALFDGLAADFVAATLLGETTDGPVSRVLNGEHWIEI